MASRCRFLAACLLLGSAAAATQSFRFGFGEETMCTGAVFDEPQRLRLKCRRVPARLLQCACSPGDLPAAAMSCRCLVPVNASGAAMELAPPVGTVEARQLSTSGAH